MQPKVQPVANDRLELRAKACTNEIAKKSAFLVVGICKVQRIPVGQSAPYQPAGELGDALHNPGPARVIAPDMRASRASRDIEALSAISLETPALLPLSPSAFLTHPFRVCGVRPIFAATDRIACQRDPC